MAGERTQSVGARKTVTVLFADLVDSTAMAEGLDPEILAGRLATYFERMRSIIESHGGTVEKFIGDAVVGVFGVPVLHEDDALRAVKASLEMQAATADLNLHARIGINTGEVVAGVSGGTSVALGHPVNVAARLQQAADSDTVLVGQATHALVDGVVQARELEPLTVKGSADPLRAWQVESLVETAPRGWQGSTPFVGRQQEVAAIEAAFELAVRESACVVVTVIAPPGLGKSRLASETMARLEKRARVVIGRCAPYGDRTTYAPVVEVIRGVNAAEAPGFLDSLLAGGPDGAQVSAQLHALVAGTALSSPEETAWAFRRLLEAMAAAMPVIAVLDDIHWADPALLDLIDYVATFSAGYPILVLCLTRPDLLDSRPGWTSSRPNAMAIRLQPLSAAEMNDLLPVDVQADELRRRIVDAAGGVPLFIEQMAALRQQQNGEVTVPPSVRALMAARVDQLNSADRALLECGAIEGETFRRVTVSALVGEPAGSGMGGQLMGLIRREFIRPERTAGAGDSFRFSHALLRDAVYSLMPRRRRADLHLRLAAMLQAGYEPADDELIGYQLETAYRERSALGDAEEDLAPLAVEAGLKLYRAGRRAMSRTDWRRAIELLTASANLLVADPGRRVVSLSALSVAYTLLPDVEHAQQSYEEAVAESTRAADKSAGLWAELARAELDAERDTPGRRARVIESADRAIAYFGERDDAPGLAYAYFSKAMAEGATDLRLTIELLKRAQEFAERADDQLIEVATWDELGGAMLAGPTPYPEVAEFIGREREWARARGITFAEADATLGEAYCLFAAGQFDEARQVLATAKALFTSLPGKISQHGEAYMLGGQLERDASSPVAAEAEYRRAIELFDDAGAIRWRRSATVGLANTLLDLNRVDEAAALLDEVDSGGSAGVPRTEAVVQMTTARLRAARGDVHGAVETGRRAVSLIADSSAILSVARVRETYAGILEMSGDPEGARDQYERAVNLYATKVFIPGEERAQASLRRLSAVA